MPPCRKAEHEKGTWHCLWFLELEAEIKQDRWAASSGVKCGEAMLQVFIEMNDHAEANRLTKRRERVIDRSGRIFYTERFSHVLSD